MGAPPGTRRPRPTPAQPPLLWGSMIRCCQAPRAKPWRRRPSNTPAPQQASLELPWQPGTWEEGPVGRREEGTKSLEKTPASAKARALLGAPSEGDGRVAREGHCFGSLVVQWGLSGGPCALPPGLRSGRLGPAVAVPRCLSGPPERRATSAAGPGRAPGLGGRRCR